MITYRIERRISKKHSWFVEIDDIEGIDRLSEEWDKLERGKSEFRPDEEFRVIQVSQKTIDWPKKNNSKGDSK